LMKKIQDEENDAVSVSREKWKMSGDSRRPS